MITAQKRRAAAAPAALPGVLHIVSGNSLAGVERYVLLLARTQMEMGMKVHVAFKRGGWLQEQLEDSGIPHTPLPLRGTVDAVSLARLAGIMRRERLQVAHGHLSRGMFYAMAVAMVTRRASVGTDHMFHPNWTMRYLHRLIVVTKLIKEASPSEIRQGRIAVVPSGVEVAKLQRDARLADEERATWEVPAGRPVIGLLGRLSNVKGHDLLLRALALIPPEERPIAVFAGPDEPEWAAGLHALTLELGLEGSVRFIGARSNVGAVLQACDLIVVPSRMEACPLVLIEAMALGRPVVATAVGGIPDVVEHGVTGLLIPPEDAAALAEVIGTALRDPALRERLGENAHAEALARYTPEAMAEATRLVYLDAAGWLLRTA